MDRGASVFSQPPEPDSSGALMRLRLIANGLPPWTEGSAVDPAASVKAVAEDRGVAYVRAGVVGDDHLAPAHVDADVVHRLVVEDEIARLQLADRHPGGVVPLAGGRVGEAHSGLAPHVHRQTGAVEAVGPGGAVDVGLAELGPGPRHGRARPLAGWRQVGGGEAGAGGRLGLDAGLGR